MVMNRKGGDGGGGGGGGGKRGLVARIDMTQVWSKPLIRRLFTSIV